jgi:hypothetical protein
MDYSYIPDLKYLLSKNKPLFKPIFSSLDETMFMFDILTKFRNNVFHHQNEIMKHQHYLCLGICGELLLAIHNWKTKYSKDIESYHCDFKFEELEETDADAAKMRCLQNVEKIKCEYFICQDNGLKIAWLHIIQRLFHVN